MLELIGKGSRCDVLYSGVMYCSWYDVQFTYLKSFFDWHRVEGKLDLYVESLAWLACDRGGERIRKH